MKFNKSWLIERKPIDDKTILKIIEWAHRKDKLLENLTRLDIQEAVKSHMRDASHAIK